MTMQRNSGENREATPGLVLAPARPDAASVRGATEQFWTAERLNQADHQPVPMPTRTQAQARQEAGARPGSAAAKAATEASPAPRPRSSSRRRTEPLPPDAPPHPCLKMFMAFGPASRPLTSVGSAIILGRRAVLTAAYCVWNQGFAQNILFIPGYRAGTGPWGRFAALRTTCLREYVESQGRDLRFDLGACVLDRPLPEACPAVRWEAESILAPGPLVSFGYPASPMHGFAFDGQQPWSSQGDYHHEDDVGFGTPQERTFAHYNDMAGGCSGGPILSAGPNAQLVGVNSHYLNSRSGGRQLPPRIHSPFLGAAFLRLIRWLEAETGESLSSPLPPSAPVPPAPASPAARLRTGLERIRQETETLLQGLPS